MADRLPLVIHDETHLRRILEDPDEARRHGVNDNIQVVIPAAYHQPS